MRPPTSHLDGSLRYQTSSQLALASWSSHEPRTHVRQPSAPYRTAVTEGLPCSCPSLVGNRRPPRLCSACPGRRCMNPLSSREECALTLGSCFRRPARRAQARSSAGDSLPGRRSGIGSGWVRTGRGWSYKSPILAPQRACVVDVVLTRVQHRHAAGMWMELFWSQKKEAMWTVQRVGALWG